MTAPETPGAGRPGGHLDDRGFGSLPDRLTTTFEQQADRFEPSNDAYARLAVAVNDASPDRRPLLSGGWFRPVIAVAAVAGIVGIGAVALQGVNDTALDTAGSAGSDDGGAVIDERGVDGDDAGDPGTENDETLQAEVLDDESGDPIGADIADDAAADGDASAAGGDGGELIGRPASSPTAAAEAFLDELGMTFLRLEADGDEVIVFSRFEGDDDNDTGFEVSRVRVVETAAGWAATEAVAASAAIDEIRLSESDPGRLLVAGSGTGFEATLDVTVLAATDGRPLAETFATAGFSDNEPFEIEIPVVGAERAWVIVSSSGAADGVTEPFAAQPVSWVAEPDTADHSVIRVEADDPDGGLVVRSGPGVASDRVGVIPGGTGDVRRNAVVPVVVGDDVWWSVTGPDGTAGWVNSTFLARSGPVADEALDRLGDQLASALIDRNEFDLANLPLSSRLPIVIGGVDGFETVSAETLRTVDGWTEQRVLTVPASTNPPFRGDLFEYHEVERWAASGTAVEPLAPGEGWVYPRNQAAASDSFGSLPSVAIVADNEETPWVRTVTYVEVTPVGPRIVGIVAEHWEP